MQLKNNSYFPQNFINSTINSLNNLIIFQDYKLKHEFELLLHDSENFSNKNDKRLTKRSNNCSNKNGNLGKSPYFFYCFVSIFH